MQDFEDWDDVGLNMPKPPDLIHLYRDYGQHIAPTIDTQDFSCAVDFDSEAIAEKEQELIKQHKELVGDIDDSYYSLSTIVMHESFASFHQYLRYCHKNGIIVFI